MTLRYTQEDWNRRWQEKAHDADWQPDPWLQRIVAFLPSGKALDIACGMGRHALFLAERGFAVTAVDYSPVALKVLDEEAGRRRLSVEIKQMDLEDKPVLPSGPFDLAINLFFLHRPLLAQVMTLIRPGGYVILRTFSQVGVEQYGPVNKEISLEPGELLQIFADWEILLYEEGLEPSKKGGTLAGIVARKKS